MSDFGELVSDMQHKANGNAAAPRATDSDAWFRTVLLPTIGRYVSAQIKPLQKRIQDLENAQREFKYCGVWEERTYHKGNFVTQDGGVWHCNCDTAGKPGSNPVAWTLAVKRAKDFSPRLSTKGVRALTDERR